MIGGIIRIGRELDKNLVGLVDDVIVGDDVAAGIDDEAGAERFTNTAAIRSAAVIRSLPARAAEEAVEEVLEVVRTLLLDRHRPALLVVRRLRIVGLNGCGPGGPPRRWVVRRSWGNVSV